MKETKLEGRKVSDVRNAVLVIKEAILQSQARSAQLINHKQLSLYYGIGRYVMGFHIQRKMHMIKRCPGERGDGGRR